MRIAHYAFYCKKKTPFTVSLFAFFFFCICFVFGFVYICAHHTPIYLSDFPGFFLQFIHFCLHIICWLWSCSVPERRPPANALGVFTKPQGWSPGTEPVLIIPFWAILNQEKVALFQTTAQKRPLNTQITHTKIKHCAWNCQMLECEEDWGFDIKQCVILPSPSPSVTLETCWKHWCFLTMYGGNGKLVHPKYKQVQTSAKNCRLFINLHTL